MKDECGQLAVFSQQGTSASHLMAARFVDALSRMLGIGGEDSDATGAYTQCLLGDDRSHMDYIAEESLAERMAQSVHG